MTITRPQIRLTLALALIVSSFSSAIAFADEKQGHDHDAMKAEMEISKSLATLSAADREQAVAQRYCPLMPYSRLGAMDPPHKVVIDGTPVFVCCEACIEDAEAGGKKTLAMAMKLTKASAAIAKMSAKDRAAAEAQKYCAIANKNLLGSMKAPIKIELGDKSVFLCCKGCVAKAKANPAATLAKAEALIKAGKHKGHGDDHAHGDHKQ
ncbi:MAG: hypothetical protein GXP26_00710 [Planctomycetes bacterium]|nr:hypothetical protein [Planctomycetota bacterium]